MSKVRRRPTRWSFHPYRAGYQKDAEGNHSSEQFRRFLKLTADDNASDYTKDGAEVWITEVGARADKVGSEAEAASDLDYLMTLPRIGTRIKRFYYYEWIGGPPFDAGLVDFVPELAPGGADRGKWANTRQVYCRYAKMVAPSRYPQDFTGPSGDPTGCQ